MYGKRIITEIFQKANVLPTSILCVESASSPPVGGGAGEWIGLHHHFNYLFTMSTRYYREPYGMVHESLQSNRPSKLMDIQV